MTEGESPRQGCAAGCGAAGLEQSRKTAKLSKGLRAEELWRAALAGGSQRGRTGTEG